MRSRGQRARHDVWPESRMDFALPKLEPHLHPAAAMLGCQLSGSRCLNCEPHSTDQAPSGMKSSLMGVERLDWARRRPGGPVGIADGRSGEVEKRGARPPNRNSLSCPVLNSDHLSVSSCLRLSALVAVRHHVTVPQGRVHEALVRRRGSCRHVHSCSPCAETTRVR